MKCNNCSSIWADDRKFDNCPICGAKIIAEKQLYTNPEEFLKFVLDKFGNEIVNYPQRCISATKDLFKGDKATAFLLETTFESGIYTKCFTKMLYTSFS